MKKILLGLVLSFFVSTSANASIIDSFDVGQEENSAVVLLTPLGDFNSVADRSFATVGEIPGFTSISGGSLSVAAASAFSFSVIWTDFDGSAFLSPSVTTIPGALSFELQGVTFGGGLEDLDLTLTIDEDTSGSTGVSTTIVSGTSGASIVFLFSDYFGLGNTLVDITSITLSGTAGAGGFFAADALIVTPEPSSLVLCGIGLVALGGYGYRRRRKSVVTTA